MSTTAARVRGWLGLAVRYAIGFLIIWWMVRTDTLDFAPLATMSFVAVVQGVALGLAIVALTALRVQYLLRDQGIRVSYRRCYVYNCMALFYSLFLPGGMSGDAARMYYFLQDVKERRIALVGALLLDRFLGLVTMIGLGILSGLFLAMVLTWIIPYLVGFTVVLVVLSVGLFLAIRYEVEHRETPGAHRLLRLWERARGTFGRLHMNDYSGRTLAVCLAISVAVNVLSIVVIYMCSLLNDAGLGFLQISAVSPLGLLTNAIPISPGGLGVGEKSFDVLYRTLGGDNGAGSFLVTRIFFYCPAVLGAVFAAWFLFKLRRPPRFDAPEAET